MNEVVGQHEVDVGVNISIWAEVFVVATGVALADTSAILIVADLHVCVCVFDVTLGKVGSTKHLKGKPPFWRPSSTYPHGTKHNSAFREITVRSLGDPFWCSMSF